MNQMSRFFDFHDFRVFRTSSVPRMFSGVPVFPDEMFFSENPGTPECLKCPIFFSDPIVRAPRFSEVDGPCENFQRAYRKNTSSGGETISRWGGNFGGGKISDRGIATP